MSKKCAREVDLVVEQNTSDSDSDAKQVDGGDRVSKNNQRRANDGDPLARVRHRVGER